MEQTMNCQRKGTNLKIDIRLALHSLGRDYNVKLDRLRIAQLEDMLAGLRIEQKARGGILKEEVAS
jgi:hypothetical protein